MNMKYQTIIANEYSDKIGSVTIGSQQVQLCDHIQIVNGRYHVSALYTEDKDTAALNTMGAVTKKMYNGTHVVYINEEMLAKAVPMYKDGMTADLIERLIKSISFMNEKKVAAVA